MPLRCLLWRAPMQMKVDPSSLKREQPWRFQARKTLDPFRGSMLEFAVKTYWTQTGRGRFFLHEKFSVQTVVWDMCCWGVPVDTEDTADDVPKFVKKATKWMTNTLLAWASEIGRVKPCKEGRENILFQSLTSISVSTTQCLSANCRILTSWMPDELAENRIKPQEIAGSSFDPFLPFSLSH